MLYKSATQQVMHRITFADYTNKKFAVWGFEKV